MDLTTLPWRGYQKYRKDGLRDLINTGWETLFVDILCYRVGYRYAIQNRLSFRSRDELRKDSCCSIYERYDDVIQYKGERGLDDPTENPEAGYRPGDRFLCRFDDATLLGPLGIGITSDYQVVSETAGPPPLVQRRTGVGIAASIATNGVRRTLAALSGNVDSDETIGLAAVAVPTWRNYYHWTLECLPRIRLLNEYADRNGEYPDLLVPADRPSWMDETLELIGYGGSIVPWDGGIKSVDRLIVPTFPDPIPSECRWLRSRMCSRIESLSEERGDRIHISRTDATVRKIANMNEIEPILDDYGFETYVLSELSVAEQIHLFANAETVISPHGAGLTNIVYADKISVIELFGNERAATFSRIARMLDHEYVTLDCDQRDVNIVVDPASLEKLLESFVR